MQFETQHGEADVVIQVSESPDYSVVIDPMSMMYLDDATMDYETTIQGSGFTFKNPNVKHTCGCGKSFGV